jgi:hypothetical protein
VPPPPANLKRRLRLETLDERAVPDGNLGDPPTTPPAQPGDPAAQATQQVFAYAVEQDGAVSSGMVTAAMSGPSSGTTAYRSLFDHQSGTIIAADSNFAGQTTVLQPPANTQPNTVYYQDPATGGWDAAPLTAGNLTLLTPAAGSSVTPILAADGVGVAWAVHDQNTQVPNGTGAAPVTANAIPPGYPPGAWAITLPPGSTIRLGNGTVITLPGGGTIIVNPLDGGFWVLPSGQPGVVEYPRDPSGAGGGRVPIPVGGSFDAPPQPPGSGTYTPGGPNGGPGNAPQPLPRPPQPNPGTTPAPRPAPLPSGFFGGAGTPGSMPRGLPVPRVGPSYGPPPPSPRPFGPRLLDPVVPSIGGNQ